MEEVKSLLQDIRNKNMECIANQGFRFKVHKKIHIEIRRSSDWM